MTDCKQYMPKVEIGEIMRAGTIGIVEARKDSGSAFLFNTNRVRW
jgi:hypothetical protein